MEHTAIYLKVDLLKVLNNNSIFETAILIYRQYTDVVVEDAIIKPLNAVLALTIDNFINKKNTNSKNMLEKILEISEILANIICEFTDPSIRVQLQGFITCVMGSEVLCQRYR